MNSRVFVRLCWSGAVLVLGACKDNPTADLAGNPQLVLINPGSIFLSEGDSTNVTIKLLDESGTPLQGTVQASSTAPAIASVALVTNAPPDPTHTTSLFRVKALVRGPAYLRAAGLGLTDSARVHVLPVPFAFDGTLSSTTPKGGDTLTLTGTGAFGFDPDSTAVLFGGGVGGPVVAATATQLKVLVPFSSADSLVLEKAVLSYVAGVTFTVPTPQIVTQTGDVYGISDSAFSTAPAIAIPPAAGRSTVFLTNVGGQNDSQCAEIVLSFGSAGPCMIYKFTLAAATSLTFTTDWDGDADIDIYACAGTNPATTCFEDGGGGATGDQPQTLTFTFPAGTHYFVIEQYDPGGGSPKNLVTTVER